MNITHPGPHIEWYPQQDHHEQQQVSQAQADAEGGEHRGHWPDREDAYSCTEREDDKPSNQDEDAENMTNSTHHTKHQEQDTTDPELHALTHSEVPGLAAEEPGYDNILAILVKETAFR